MKETKFRVWDKIDKLLYIPNKIVFKPKETYFLNSADERTHVPEEGVLMQFTGMLDKQNKEIYEGDIVKYNYHIDKDDEDFLGEVIYKIHKFDKGEVNFYNIGFILRGIDIDKSYWYLDIPDLEDIEVIGNIYENGDLIKESK